MTQTSYRYRCYNRCCTIHYEQGQ